MVKSLWNGILYQPTLSQEEFRAVLKISPNTFREGVRNGSIPAPTVVVGERSKRWSGRVVRAFIEGVVE